MNNETAYSNESYGKKSIWQKMAMYLIIGLVVYGLFYYFVIAKNNSYGQTGQNNAPAVQNSGTKNAVPPQTANQTENTVTLTNDGYSPQTLTIKSGSKVAWINKSGQNATVSSDPHPTHTDYPPLNLGKFADGEQLSLIFNTPGTYKYHNHLNSSETGSIIVQ